MMYLKASLLFIASLIAISNANTLQGTIDLNRLQSILLDNVKSTDVSSLYYAARGLKQLNAKIPITCENLKQVKYDTINVEQVFQLASTAALTNCQNFLAPSVLSVATKALDNKEASIPEIYHAVYTLKALGKGTVYDKEDGLKNLIQLLKKDDSPANYAYVFGLCEHMGCTAWSASHSESVLLAADESDARALHFEGGLPVTANLLSTIARSYKSLKKASPLSEEQRLKFAEYLLSRRSVNTAKGAALLAEAALAIADDQPTPIAITIKGKKYITSEVDSIEVSITNLVGRAIPNLKPDEVVAQSGTRLADDVVVLSKQPLTQKPNEQTTFILNLSKIKTQYGVYKIALSAGSKIANLNVAVLGEIQIPNIEVGVGDIDGTTSPKTNTITFPNKMSEPIQADHLQKVTLKFTIRDKASKPVLVQQAFVHIGRDDDETVFVAEPDNNKAYKVELNVGTISKVLKGSGSFALSVFAGDSAAAAPVRWALGDVVFNFGKAEVAVNTLPVRGPLPAIRHTFRTADAVPPRFVSDVFAVSCAAPLVLLLVTWASLGVNLSNMPLTPYVLIFHAGLGGSLALYGVLWVKLSMFETVRYLLPLGLVTFLSGHRLLRRLVQDKQLR